MYLLLTTTKILIILKTKQNTTYLIRNVVMKGLNEFLIKIFVRTLVNNALILFSDYLAALLYMWI